MTNYNIINTEQHVRYAVSASEVITYQFRAEEVKDRDSTLIHRRFSSFGECKVSLALLGSLVVALNEVIAPPCYWLTHKAMACFYRERSSEALKHNQLADKAIAPWFKERTIYVLPTAIAISALGLVGALASIFVSVQEDTTLFSTIAKIDRWLLGISEENYLERSAQDRFENDPYFAPELQPIASGKWKSEGVHVNNEDIIYWFTQHVAQIKNHIDTEGVEGFLKRHGV